MAERQNDLKKHTVYKLSNSQIRMIRLLYSTGNYTQKQLAVRYNVHHSYISRLVNKNRRTNLSKRDHYFTKSYLEKRLEFFHSNYKIVNDCWIWTGASFGNIHEDYMYGAISYKGKKTYAHHFSYMMFIGEIPEGKWVLHDCPNGDNPKCVNPDHLWLGTPKQNTQDSINKGSRSGRAGLPGRR